MSSVINCSINVKAITKDKIKVHPNGKHYWNFTVKERKTPDEYNNTHYVVESQTKDERAAKAPVNYLDSSGKEFIFNNNALASNDAANTNDDDDDDLPF